MAEYTKELLVEGKYTAETIRLEEDIWMIKKDGEELIRIIGGRVVDNVIKLLKEMDLEIETYKSLWENMAYYFDDDVKSLKDLDHKDFHSLKRLSKGLMD